MTADQLAQQVESLLRAAGGAERVRELLGAMSVAELWSRLAEQEGKERARIAENTRKLNVAADNPELIWTAEEVLAKQPAHKLTPIVARLARWLPEAPDGRTARLVRQVEAINAFTEQDQRIKEALRQTGGNQAAAARLLGKTPKIVRAWLRRHGA